MKIAVDILRTEIIGFEMHSEKCEQMKKRKTNLKWFKYHVIIKNWNSIEKKMLKLMNSIKENYIFNNFAFFWLHCVESQNYVEWIFVCEW